MSRYKFQKGDRVVVVRPNEDDIKMGVKKGDAGEVLQDNNVFPWVRMDIYNSKLNRASGLCENGHGRFFRQEQLELEEK